MTVLINPATEVALDVDVPSHDEAATDAAIERAQEAFTSWRAVAPGERARLLRAFAAKVDDGAMRALPPVLAAALRYWGIDNEVVARWSAVPVLGGGAPVGAISWSSELKDLLGI